MKIKKGKEREEKGEEGKGKQIKGRGNKRDRQIRE